MLGCSWPRAGVALMVVLLPRALAESSDGNPSLAQTRDLMQAGASLSAEAVEALESKLEIDAQNISARIQLIGYYEKCNSRARAGQNIDDHSDELQGHAFWIIEHVPHLPIAGLPVAQWQPWWSIAAQRKAEHLWRQQVEKDDATVAVLSNAAAFFTSTDQAFARSILVRARKIEPTNAKLAKLLGNLYLLELTGDRERDREIGRNALEALETALQSEENSQRFYLLGGIARAALAAGEFDQAQAYAKELLNQAIEFGPGNWNYGYAVHHGNLVLGHIALANDKIDDAAEFLRRAGKTPGGPNLFGPNMALAKALLDVGRTEDVIKYLELCRKVWNRPQFNDWIKAIQDGHIPDFGPKVTY